MTEWMFQDVCDVEEWYVCSSSLHQARCDVALDMGHSRPAGTGEPTRFSSGCGHDAMREQCRLVAQDAVSVVS